MGGLFTKAFIISFTIFSLASSIRITQGPNKRLNQALSLLSKINGGSSGGLALNSILGQSTGIEQNSNNSSQANKNISALLSSMNQSGLILSGSSSGHTATSGDNVNVLAGLFAGIKSTNSAVSVLNSTGGQAASTTDTTARASISTADINATQNTENVGVSELQGQGNATTATINNQSLQVGPTQTAGSQGSDTASDLTVDDGAGNLQTASGSQMNVVTPNVSASMSSSSSSTVQIIGSGTANTTTSNSNNILIS